MGGPISKNVYDYDYNDPGIGFFFRGLKYDPVFEELEKLLRINVSGNNSNVYR